ncbi:Protein of unknown function [Bacillus mobilis]|nr:Protein of unknown function [Bacillus mobilis]
MLNMTKKFMIEGNIML